MSLKRVNLRVKSTGVYPCFDAEVTIRRHFSGAAERSSIASIAPIWPGTSLARMFLVYRYLHFHTQRHVWLRHTSLLNPLVRCAMCFAGGARHLHFYYFCHAQTSGLSPH